MKIEQKKIYSGKRNLEFVRHGFAEELMGNLVFSYRTLAGDKTDSKSTFELYSMSEADREASIENAVQQRSSYMEHVMEMIANAVPCFQFTEDEPYSYESDKWDLFFWCNHFSDTGYYNLEGRDYSYFSLSFNKLHSKEHRDAILEKVLNALSGYRDDEHISMTVHSIIELDEKRIQEEAERVSSQLIGKKVEYTPSDDLYQISYSPMQGRVVENNGQLFFMKNRARTRGYLLESTDILKLYWNLEESEAAGH